MIEITLVSKGDRFSNVSRFVSRKRFSPDVMGVGVNEVIKGFIRANLNDLESVINNSDLVSFLNSDQTMSNKDFQSIKYLLGDLGYDILVYFVADDEENALEVGDGTYEYNVIDNTFLQNDYPTVTKIIIPNTGSVTDVIERIVSQSGLFNESKLGIKNPFTVLINNLRDQQNTLGASNGMLITRIYNMLSATGIDVQVVLPM
jgi:hypothetical protein